jgi:hypothetical protein
LNGCYASGNPQGKAYALTGTKQLSPHRFTELLAALAKSSDKVKVMRGCIGAHEALRDIAKQIDSQPRLLMVTSALVASP